MGMNNIDLFKLALGLRPPWHVKKTRFYVEQDRLGIFLDFTPGGKFDCPVCEEKGRKAVNTSERVWRHINFFQHTTYDLYPICWTPKSEIKYS